MEDLDKLFDEALTRVNTREPLAIRYYREQT
jgi:hypothetical protein